MLKVDRQGNSLGILIKVLTKEVTPIVATLTIAFMLVIILATLMYYMENGAQPEAYSSIPASMWWSVTALTSVGYGDVFPVTIGGKLLGCFACLFGSAIIALPTGILSNGFNEEIAHQNNKEQAEAIEESVLDASKKLDALSTEVTGLHTALDNMDASQKQVIRALRLKFPEKVAEILGEEDGQYASQASPDPEEELDLDTLREKVERNVASLKKKTK
jgi:voltage-gated potassium channel